MIYLSNTYTQVFSEAFCIAAGFIGYAADLYGIVTEKPIANSDDDQLYYTQIFLDEALRVR